MKFTGIWYLAVQGVLYTIAASEGSVYMMRKLIQNEKGKRTVGNQFTQEEVETLKTMAAVYSYSLERNETAVAQTEKGVPHS